MAILIKNLNFKSERTKAIEAAALELSQAFIDNPNVETATLAQVNVFCPLIVALGEMTEGEIDQLCQYAGVEMIRE